MKQNEQLLRYRDLAKTVRTLTNKGVTLGEFLAEIRYSYGTSYRELAEIIGVVTSRLTNIIHGYKGTAKESTFLDYLYKLDKVFNFDLEELVKLWD